jgi:hypothetical protein
VFQRGAEQARMPPHNGVQDVSALKHRGPQGVDMSFKAQWYKDKLAKKASRGMRGYPVATVAFYGPDARRATKVAVGVMEREGLQADVLERWWSETTDVRADAEITEAIVRFIEGHGAKSVVVADRIIGCPHEEGTDYPEGEKCPKCPYWATRDRWSGETVQ